MLWGDLSSLRCVLHRATRPQQVRQCKEQSAYATGLVDRLWINTHQMIIDHLVPLPTFEG